MLETRSDRSESSADTLAGGPLSASDIGQISQRKDSTHLDYHLLGFTGFRKSSDRRFEDMDVPSLARFRLVRKFFFQKNPLLFNAWLVRNFNSLFSRSTGVLLALEISTSLSEGFTITLTPSASRVTCERSMAEAGAPVEEAEKLQQGRIIWYLIREVVR